MDGPAASGRVLPPEFLDLMQAVCGDRLQLGDAIRLEHGRSETHFAPNRCISGKFGQRRRGC